MPSTATPTIVGSENAGDALVAGMDVLRRGGSCVDAIETAIRIVEADPDEHYVGVGGLPNILGDVELDAAIMTGQDRRAGAVAAVRDIPHPISVARRVMEDLPQHVLLVGTGAKRFARECGIDHGETLTERARELWLAGIAQHADDNGTPAGDARYLRAVRAYRTRIGLPDAPWGTVNVLALDRQGNLCAGTSTSGYPWKYPGRVGDSAAIGAGLYCDNRYGAVACTGRGELTMRANTAGRAIQLRRHGAPARTACSQALHETFELIDEFRADVTVHLLGRDGNHAASSTSPKIRYAYMSADDTSATLSATTTVATPDNCATECRWDG